MSFQRIIFCGMFTWLLAGGLAVAQEQDGGQPVLPERGAGPQNVAPGQTPPGQFQQGPFQQGPFQQGPQNQFAPGQIPPGAFPPPGPGPFNGPPMQGPGVPPGLAPRGPIAGAPYGIPDALPTGPVPRLRDSSLIYIGTPPNKGIREHDIVTVIIDERSEVTQTSRFDRQRNTLFRAQLREFIRIGTSGNLRPAATDQPQIDAQLRSQLNSYGNGRTNEGLKFRIAATVVDVRPNGVLVLEARKTIITDTGVWVYTMTGNCRTQDILSNNSIISENIADMKLSKLEEGKISDSTARGWLTKLYDVMLPF